MSSMLRIALLLLLIPTWASARFLPEALGEFERQSLEEFQPAEFEIFREMGLDAAEQAVYRTPDGLELSISAIRFQDGTGAFAAYQWLRPAGKSVPYGEEASQRGDRTVIRFGNYVIQMTGATPIDDHVEVMLAFLPSVQMTPAPPLVGFVPTDQIVESSRRHVLGPAALEKLAPEVPPSVAAFHFGTEGQFARYQTASGELRFILLSYPSPQIAHGQIDPFQKLPEVVAKRSGPLIAAVLSPSSADEAQHLLSRVRYAAEITVNPYEPGRHDDLGALILDIVLLCFILAVIMIVGGVILAGGRRLVRRVAPDSIFASPEGSGMVQLDIEKRD